MTAIVTSIGQLAEKLTDVSVVTERLKSYESDQIQKRAIKAEQLRKDAIIDEWKQKNGHQHHSAPQPTPNYVPISFSLPQQVSQIPQQLSMMSQLQSLLPTNPQSWTKLLPQMLPW